MHDEIGFVWSELYGDLLKEAFVWQIAIIVSSLIGAFVIGRLIRAYVQKSPLESWQINVDGFNRIMFPIFSLIFIYVICHFIDPSRHVSLITVIKKLLWTIALIRIIVYAIRYAFAPVKWVITLERLVSRAIWVILGLQLLGVWSDLVTLMEEITFQVGKTQFNLLFTIQVVLTIIITLFISLSVSKLIENKLMRSEHIDLNARVVLSKLVRIFISLMAILIALSQSGFDITLLSVFGGALGVGLGFGLQKIASNYFSGFILLMDNALHIGDVVTIDTHTGVVSELHLRYMILKKNDGSEVVISHESLLNDKIVNLSHTDRNTRIALPVQISYDSDLQLAMKLMLQATKLQSRVLDEPPVDVLIKNLDHDGINLLLVFWINDPEITTAKLESDIYLEILTAFKKSNIRIPYPQREVKILSTQLKELGVSEVPEAVQPIKAPMWDDVR
jgi:small-conductance mechanosensitive channel